MNYPPITLVTAADPTADRDTFHQQRKEYFTASHAANLFGQHPFETAADYFIEKITGNQVEETDAMRRGNHLEPAVASWFSDEIGIPVTKDPSIYARGHLAATPDYTMYEGDNNVLVEIKTTAKHNVTEIERYWYWQVQAQMLCTDTNKAYVVWVDASMTIQWQEVDANPDDQELLWNKSKEFIEAVDAEIMPEWVETEARHIIAMYPEPSDSLEAGEHGMDLTAQYWGHKQAAKYHDAEAAKLRDELFTLAGNHAELTQDGETVVTLRPRKVAARFDTKRFAHDHPNLHLEYMSEPTTTRVVNVPKNIRIALEGDQ